MARGLLTPSCIRAIRKCALLLNNSVFTCWVLGLALCFGMTQRKQISSLPLSHDSLHLHEEVITLPRALPFRLKDLAS